MQIKKTELAKIIREEIANAVNGERSYGQRLRRSMDPARQIAKSRAIQYEKEKDSLEMGYNDAMAGEPRKSKKLAYNRAYDRALGKMDAEAGRPKSPPEGSLDYHYNQGYDRPDEAELMKEDEIKAARYDSEHLPGNTEPGQVGNVQQLEEVGILSTLIGVKGLSLGAKMILAFLDPILTLSGVSVAAVALMNYLKGANKDMEQISKIQNDEAVKLQQAFRQIKNDVGSGRLTNREQKAKALAILRATMGLPREAEAGKAKQTGQAPQP